jgi:hypothetical protein
METHTDGMEERGSALHIELREYFRFLRANPFERLRDVRNWPPDIPAQIVDRAEVDAKPPFPCRFTY